MEEREKRSVNTDSKETLSAPCSSPASAPEAGSKAEDDGADKLDVCSDKFDPLLALYSPTVQLPIPNIKCFNNVAEYESFLKGGRGRAKPENVEKRQRKAMKGVVDLERIERLKKLMVNNPVSESEEGESSSGTTRRKRRQKPVKNVLTRMPLCKGSPLGELYRCVEERIRVKVHVRTFKGLRGVCSGFVVAFDKFWNMAMVDVDETYREPLFGEAFYHEKALTTTRLFEKLSLQETSECAESVKKQPADSPKETPESCSSSPAVGVRRDSRTADSDLSGAAETEKVAHKTLLVVQSPQARQKKETKTYGKVHTRHINQLFIRGENVILVNPQPL
ncbi:U7 snRNA-associated Sm-like protein LSm11 isoform X1 [Simochromis diagramma]|uniref:U7 snRNA-associated Sm-like protein LSm11 isoform X1 n=1 Tax=Simochromis diagramma TaxID=43689 RepID=UPI001A7EC6D0|nr:U7 snRNA-associated Sm-like protein LSm11 isoform X1 [Simochromis diagramma]